MKRCGEVTCSVIVSPLSVEMTGNVSTCSDVLGQLLSLLALSLFDYKRHFLAAVKKAFTCFVIL